MPPPLKISTFKPGRLHALERLGGVRGPCERLVEPRLVSLDVLRAAVVGEHAAELQVRQLVDELRERERLIAGRHAAARADRHIDDDVGGDAGGFRRVRQIPRVLRIVHRLDELAILLAKAHRPLNLRLAEIRGRHADLLDALGEQRLGFGQLGGADADGARRQLQLRDVGRLVRLRVRPRTDLRGCEARAHRRDVLLELVEIEHERRRVEIPLGHTAARFQYR